jgi:Rrf2 family protein
MFTQTVEYALRAVVHLAQQAPKASTTEEVADATHVPRAYLAKILSGLRRAGLVKSQRGLGGGITLARQPEDLTILDVVNAVEPIKRIRTCPLGLSEHGSNLCPLHSRMDAALAMVETAFKNSTLSEVLTEETSSIPLCPFPPTELCGDQNRAWALNRTLAREMGRESEQPET